MELALIIWLASMANDIRNMLVVIAFISTGVFCILGMLHISELYSDTKRSTFRWLATITFVTCLGTIVVPKERTVWLMVAGYTAQSVYQSAVGTKLTAIVEQKLDGMVADMSKEESKPRK